MDEHQIIADPNPHERRHVVRESASEAVVRAVADARGRDPIELPPLHNVIDPDALNELFSDTIAGTARSGRLVFEYGGCTVALDGPNEVLVNVRD